MFLSSYAFLTLNSWFFAEHKHSCLSGIVMYGLHVSGSCPHRTMQTKGREGRRAVQVLRGYTSPEVFGDQKVTEIFHPCCPDDFRVQPQIWQGSHEAAHPMWASDQGFECILTIADPRFPDKKLGWLDDDGDIDHLRVEAEVQTAYTR